MRFAFTDDQLALRDAVRELLARECPPARVRAAWSDPTGRSGVWAALADMGVLGVLAPEQAGGLGATEVDLVLLLEESGRVALAEPIVETAAIAVPLLAEAGDARVAELAAGTLTAAVVGPLDELAVWADTAGVVVLCDEAAVSVVAATGVALEPRTSVDGARRLFWIDVVPGAAPQRVADRDGAARVLDRGALGVAAQLVGLADRMLELTVDYVRDRHQFGVPVGSFQAVKHHLANARLQLEFARPLLYRAAVSIATDDPDRAVHTSMAKVYANEAAAITGRAALQCHGAIGYTTEYDLHLFLKRSWALRRSWGDTTWHRRRVGRAIL